MKPKIQNMIIIVVMGENLRASGETKKPPAQGGSPCRGFGETSRGWLVKK
jgi:hypothetical protein